MIGNLKLGMKALRYGYGIKMNLLLGGLFLVLGAAMAVLNAMDPNGNYLLANFMIMCVGLLPGQVLNSLMASNLVQASPKNRRLQTAAPAALTWGIMTFLYLLSALVRGIVVLRHPEKTAAMCTELVTLGVFMVAIMLYMGIAFKYFVIPLFFFFLFFLFSYQWIQILLVCLEWGTGILRLVLAAAAGLACIAAGGYGQYLVSLAVYRAPASKLAQPAPLRKML